MEKRLISEKNLLFPHVDGKVIFSAIVDLDHYCLVIKRKVHNEETARQFIVATSIGGDIFYNGFDFKKDALRFAAIDVIDYVIK